jgi:DMSO/TMAO reductase YedYZ molybdopterin-dependent catalytic subunit
LKERLFKILLVLMTVGLMLSSSFAGVLALEASDNDVTPTGGNSGWILQIDIYANNTLNNTYLSFDDLVAMPKTIVYAELSCYGKLIESGQWGGVRLGVLLEKAGFNEQTANLAFYATDGYTMTFSMSDATPKNVIIAYELDGSSLPETLRLVIPGENGESWISMITVISINSPIYPHSSNPEEASVVRDRPTLQSSPTPQPSPTPEQREQPTPQPTVPLPTNQPAQQQDSSRSSLQIEYGYPIVSGIIVAVTIAIGYLFYKRRK